MYFITSIEQKYTPNTQILLYSCLRLDKNVYICTKFNKNSYTNGQIKDNRT